MEWTEIIRECIDLRKQGLQAKLNKHLHNILANRYEIAFSTHDAEIANMFTLCLIQTLQLDMCENEDEEIDVCKLAYFNISNVIDACQDKDLKVEAYRLRTLLLSGFGEYLNESLLSIFFNERVYTSEEYMAQRNICEDYINKMQLSDIYTIDDITEGQYSDDLLNEIGNNIEEETARDVEEINKAALIHKVLHKFITAGFKK